MIIDVLWTRCGRGSFLPQKGREVYFGKMGMSLTSTIFA